MIRSTDSTPNTTITNDRSGGSFLSLNEAAAMLDCSRRFLEIRIEDGELRVFRPSKRLVRIKRTELERWVESYSAKAGGLT
jgi:excisionase family DNA binding protein